MFLFGWGRLWGSGHGGDPHLRSQGPTGAIGDLPASRLLCGALQCPPPAMRKVRAEEGRDCEQSPRASAPPPCEAVKDEDVEESHDGAEVAETGRQLDFKSAVCAFCSTRGDDPSDPTAAVLASAASQMSVARASGRCGPHHLPGTRAPVPEDARPCGAAGRARVIGWVGEWQVRQVSKQAMRVHQDARMGVCVCARVCECGRPLCGCVCVSVRGRVHACGPCHRVCF